jgi:hypothetical protein
MPLSKPFTYLVGWSQHQRFYYGVRYAIDAHPDSLWTTYFTSSKPVQEFTTLYGAPDIIQIRRTFIAGDQARKWERTVLRRLRVVQKPQFLNLSDRPAPPSRLGTSHSAPSLAKMCKPHSTDRKANISTAIQGMKARFQKRWLITTPYTQFCVRSLDILLENDWSSLYCSFRSGRPMSRGALKGWKLEQI